MKIIVRVSYQSVGGGHWYDCLYLFSYPCGHLKNDKKQDDKL